MPNQLIEEAISHLNNAKDLLTDSENLENLEKAIQQLSVAMNKGITAIPEIVKLLGANKLDVRTTEKRNEKIRRAVLVQKLLNEGLTNKIIAQRLNMSLQIVTVIKKEIDQLKDDAHFIDLMNK